MALYTKKEFTAICGIRNDDLSIYVKRKKVVLTGEMVDDTILVNKNFIEKRKMRMGDAPIPVKKQPKIKEIVSVLEEKSDEIEKEKPISEEKDIESMSLPVIEREKKIADLLKVKAD